ncbi:hypothetical protein J4Q44_G00195110 [Coregonus suidteri]|uniref:Uncharacterized protein n=1 Tax=Coregonus suidteri TaxID=861788 RepID=A0AAN8LF02_9TELE
MDNDVLASHCCSNSLFLHLFLLSCSPHPLLPYLPYPFFPSNLSLATNISSLPQFYRCFLILFRCERRSMENGLSSMPSKTTVIQLNRRVYSNTVACTAQISTGTHNYGCSTPATERTNPPEVTS